MWYRYARVRVPLFAPFFYQVKKTFISKSVKDTKKIAKSLSSKLKDNVVILSGPLGSGKTEFVKGLAEALGIKDVIKSPSFSKMN
ncbi:MAG: hypothetical protein DRP42_06020 [Tenericutes bacterium]|nr:MAG: hypothetical protein DRP42_06020 [Mycoplasmatota bacterium]